MDLSYYIISKIECLSSDGTAFSIISTQYLHIMFHSMHASYASPSQYSRRRHHQYPAPMPSTTSRLHIPVARPTAITGIIGRSQ